jgi:ketosteroid isomerase-like protein
MPAEELELARRLFPGPVDLAALFGDPDGLAMFREQYEPLVDPDVEAVAMPGHVPVSGPGVETAPGEAGPVARGIDGLITAYSDWVSAFERWEVTPVDYIETGDGRVIVDVEIAMRSKTGGVELTTEGSNLLTFRDGRLKRMENFLNRSGAREAAGLTS